jgi:WD40 repeat protein
VTDWDARRLIDIRTKLFAGSDGAGVTKGQMTQAGKTFRIFVSSTFSDLKEERNALQKYVFPRLRELCMQHGCRFQAIDLRWGVSEEASLDQQTVKICLQEIKRCQKVTPRPNFVVLLGDRYGWRPLPAEIPTTEYEEIERRVVSDDDQALLKAWYRRDDNAVPPVYCLQARTGDFTGYARWQEVERRLHAVLLQATAGMTLDAGERVKYTASATEQEIVCGALDVPDAQQHVFCFFRQITNRDDLINELPHSENVRDFVDVDESQRPNPEAFAQQRELRQRLRDSLPDNIHDYAAEWRADGITLDHIGTLPETLEDCLGLIEDDRRPSNLCVDVWTRLARIILDEIGRIESIDPLDKEIEDHKNFGQERAKFFTGRAGLRQTISDYVKGTDPRPLAVFGASGSGKTALLAQALAECGLPIAECVIVSRLIGATPNSSDGRALLESLCRQISRRYGADEATVPAEYQKLAEEFHKRLALATADKPLVVFLDALDQLSDAEHARNLIWLPTDLPPHVRLIVSTLPGECLTQLERRLPASNLVKLEPMPVEEGNTLLERWLEEAGRRLQGDQRAEVLGKFVANGLPLYLRLAFEEARFWESYAGGEKTKLSDDTEGIIRDLLTRLSSETNHGQALVSHSIGYIAATRHGISEDELLDVLSNDGEVIEDFRRHSPKSPHVDQLPIVVWSRLYFELEPYLTARSASGTTVMTFAHRQLGAIARVEYLGKKTDLQARHEKLAEYFCDRTDPKHDATWTGNYPRGLRELPYHLLHGGRIKEVQNLYADSAYLEAVCVASDNRRIADEATAPEAIRKRLLDLPDGASDGEILALLANLENEAAEYVGIFDLLANLQEAMKVLAASAEVLPVDVLSQLRATNQLLSERTRLITKFPKSISQEIANYLDTYSNDAFVSPLRERAARQATQGLIIRRRVLTSSADSGNSAEVTALVASPSGSHFLSGGVDGSIGYWQVDKERPLWLIATHKGRATCVTLSPNGNQALSAGEDGSVLIWDVNLAACRTLLPGGSSIAPWSYASFCAFLDDENVLATKGGRLRKLNIYTGTERWHNDEVFAAISLYEENQVAFSYLSGRIAAGDKHGETKVFDARRGEMLVTLQSPGPISYSALSADGTKLVTSDKQGRLTAFDLMSRRQIDSISVRTFRVLCRATGDDCFYACDFDGSLLRISVDDRIHLETKHSLLSDRLQDLIPSSMACLPDDTLVMGFRSGGIALIDFANETVLRQWEPAGSFCLGALFPQWRGAIGIAGTRTASKIPTGKNVSFISPSGEMKVAEQSPHTQFISGVTVLESNLALTVDKSGTAVVWRGQDVATTYRLTGVDFTACTTWPDMSLGIAGTQDDTVIVLGRGGSVKELPLPSNTWKDRPGISALAVAGKPMQVFAIYFSGEVRFSGERNWEGQGHPLMGTAATIGPAFRFAASGSLNGDVQLWRCADGIKEEAFALHQGTVIALAFSHDGTRLYTAGADRCLYCIDTIGKRVLHVTLLPSVPIALLTEPDDWLTILVATGNIYGFSSAAASEPNHQPYNNRPSQKRGLLGWIKNLVTFHSDTA